MSKRCRYVSWVKARCTTRRQWLRLSAVQVLECLRSESQDNLKREVNFAPTAIPPTATATDPAQCASSDGAPHSGETFPDVRLSALHRIFAAEVQASPGLPASAHLAAPELRRRPVRISRKGPQAAQLQARCC